MKIKEVITEAGFFKGVAKAIAPQTIQAYDQQKNALRTPQTDGDPSMANVASSTSNVATNISQVSTTPTATSTSVNINKIQPALTTRVPTQPTAQTSQDRIRTALKARQAAGLSAYESLDYTTFKQRLQEAKAQ